MNLQIIESIKQPLHQHLPAGGHALLFGSQARGGRSCSFRLGYPYNFEQGQVTP